MKEGWTSCPGPGWQNMLAIWLREGAVLWPGVLLGWGNRNAWEW